MLCLERIISVWNLVIIKEATINLAKNSLLEVSKIYEMLGGQINLPYPGGFVAYIIIQNLATSYKNKKVGGYINRYPPTFWFSYLSE